MGNHKKGSIETWQPQTLSDKRKEEKFRQKKGGKFNKSNYNTERREEVEKEN